MIVVSIDPGALGALAFFNGTTLLDVIDMPAIQIPVGKTKRNRISAGMLASAIFKHGHVDHIYVETVMPTPQIGVVGAFGLGVAQGVVDGVAAALGLPITHIRPQEWKKALGLDADKDRSRFRAIELFPQHADRFKLKKSDGLAEAALIGFYAIQLLSVRQAAWSLELNEIEAA